VIFTEYGLGMLLRRERRGGTKHDGDGEQTQSIYATASLWKTVTSIERFYAFQDSRILSLDIWKYGKALLYRQTIAAQ
jgi:hypothetical protein